jgi:hypothetical protein
MHQNPSRYAHQEIDQGLLALVLASGNSRRAAAMLADRGLEIPTPPGSTAPTPTATSGSKRRAR